MRQKYASLIVNYCLDVEKGDRVFISSTSLAEPLLKHIHDYILQAGGHPYIQMSVANTAASFYQYANQTQLLHVNEFSRKAIEDFEAYLVVRAPHNLSEEANVDSEKRAIKRAAAVELNKTYFERTANGSLKRTLCQYPTVASAQEANMSLEEYQQFVYTACGLLEDNPIEYWLSVRKKQQKLVDYLNDKQVIRYVTRETDISFNTKGRTWINSDGRTNMPSGEVFTAPVEDSVNGHILFSYPSIYQGKSVEEVRLEVKNGVIQSWQAKAGQEVLDEVFAINGARVFGEAAIGTNYNIQQITKNILFDEKIGGSIHMAVGQSYKQCGGKNQSVIHWDMITDMKHGGKIYADEELFYADGKVITQL